METRPRSIRRSRWAAIGAAIAVSLGGGGVFLAGAAPSAPSSVVTIDPVRVLDTRDPVNVGLPGPFVSPVSQKLTVTGSVATTSGPTTAGAGRGHGCVVERDSGRSDGGRVHLDSSG